MSRTVSQTLLDAIQNQQGETILRVKTWLNLAAYNAAPTVPEQTWQTNKFKIEGTEAEAALISETNDYTVSDFTVFLIERGVSISGVEYVMQSGLYFVSKFEEKAGRINIKGSSFPDQKIVIDGDDTYENVITDFCTEIGKTAVFKDTGAAWLSYQFLPAGKQVILNKAERFLNLIRQKYLIQCYERSPKELVFFQLGTDQTSWKDIIYNDSKAVLIATSGYQSAYSSDGLAFTKTTPTHYTNSIAYSPSLDLFIAVGASVCMSSPDGATWTSRTIPAGTYLSVTWSSALSKFVAVGTTGNAYSSDGINWTAGTSPWTARTLASSTWASVAYSPSLDIYVAVGSNCAASSSNGTTWTTRSIPSGSWLSVSWDATIAKFVAVQTSNKALVYSADGINWTKDYTAWTSREAVTFNDVAWNGTVFVGVGDGIVKTSTDGLAWTNRTPGNSNTWKSVTWASSLGLFVAVAVSGAGDRVQTSPDGVTWTVQTPSNNHNWFSICWSGSLLVASGYNTSTGEGAIMTSSNATAWTARTSPTGCAAFLGVTYSNTFSKFVAVCTNDRMATSSDGITWSAIVVSGYFSNVLDANGITVAIGNSVIVTSTDGSTWTSRYVPTGGTWSSIDYSSSLDLFVAVGTAQTSVTSPDGITWTTNPIIEYTAFNTITWASSLGIFLATGTSISATTTTAQRTDLPYEQYAVYSNSGTFVSVGYNTCYTSTNGTSWTSRSIPAGIYLAITYDSTNSLFIAVGTSCATSPDGITWTSRTIPAGTYYSITTASDIIVAVGASKCATSTDGITWTERTIPALTFNCVSYSSSLDLFIALPSTGNIAVKSSDGITWTNIATPENAIWKALHWNSTDVIFIALNNSGTNRLYTASDPSINQISYGNSITTSDSVCVAVGTSTAFYATTINNWIQATIPAGTYHKVIYANSLFVAVGASKCATSPDGITWTERTIPAGTYTALAYSPTLDLFLAMGDNLAATSPDGVTWTSRTAPADQAWQAVTWADDLAQFIAVSSEGDNRIASSTDGINWQILTAQADYSLSYLDGPTSSILHGTNTVHYISRDEASAVNTEGDTSYPAWNLGYLESTASAPATNTDPFYKFFLQKAPLRLDITDGDRIHFEPSWTLDPTLPIDAMVTIIEIFDSTKSPAWYQEIRSLALFDSVEGGSLPSTIERVAAYTPLVSSGFDGNLTPEVNNLQALAEAVDDLNIAGGSIPATTAANDFQVGDGAGAWVKKTLAQTITILGIFADAASDGVYYVRRNLGWTNLKTYTDTLYSLLGHVHAATDITSGNLALARLALVKLTYAFGSYTTLGSPVTTTNAIPFSSTLPSYTTYPTQYNQAIFVGATNDSSNYWTLNLIDAGTGTTIASVNTQGLGANAGYTLTDTTLALSSLTQGTHKYIYVQAVKTGTPSNINVHCPAVEYKLTP